MFNEDLPLEVRKALFDNKLAMAQKNADVAVAVAVAEKAVAIHKYPIRANNLDFGYLVHAGVLKPPHRHARVGRFLLRKSYFFVASLPPQGHESRTF